MRKVLEISSAPRLHWVGDGFPVRSLFSHVSHGERVSPFLLLDYAGPAEFAPTDKPRGVGTHPHRGFEVVTIVYKGEVEHRDSTGKGGVIGPGDVQWMTAAGGILHKEFHSDAFTQLPGVARAGHSDRGLAERLWDSASHCRRVWRKARSGAQLMHGPFAMNTADEIRQAMVDFQNGRFGEIAA